MSVIAFQPYWFDQAMAQEAPVASPALTGTCRAQIGIVGGGFSGLWSAIKIKQKCPQAEVTLIESGWCGQGASGRNGGAMLTWSTKLPTLIKLYGLSAALTLVQQSEQAARDIAGFCCQYGIDAELRLDGAYYTATSAAQRGVMPPILAMLERHGLNNWQQLTSQALLKQTGSALHLDGYFSPQAGSVQPAKLVRGLKQVASQLGVQIYEHSPMLGFEAGRPNKVKTQYGSLVCDTLILATNSWLPRQVPSLSRAVSLVSSDMLITEAAPQTLEALGLKHGGAVIDCRTFVHYYRTTPDGRLMLGKGGNRFAFANRMDKGFDAQSPREGQLQQALRRFFPDSGLQMQRSWNGASDRSATGMPFFGHLPGQPTVLYALGYSGNGVVQTYLGGEILSSMALGLQDKWSQSALICTRPLNFPPEPFRYLGALAIRDAIRRKEAREDADLVPRVWDKQLARLANFAGKADYD
ncbi:FAD-dependent oxidoreductase [Bowmanella yangjiangensis]|uniref:FAD-dependent oxidoreductase n=1 Tax=Bowmanella yangjiangensis TaxID=2811230 RepID=UPI001E36462F|nr:FAD-dependent oxidoreductase [Bowmanella yangjiangensis]